MDGRVVGQQGGRFPREGRASAAREARARPAARHIPWPLSMYNKYFVVWCVRCFGLGSLLSHALTWRGDSYGSNGEDRLPAK